MPFYYSSGALEDRLKCGRSRHLALRGKIPLTSPGGAKLQVPQLQESRSVSIPGSSISPFLRNEPLGSRTCIVSGTSCFIHICRRNEWMWRKFPASGLVTENWAHASGAQVESGGYKVHSLQFWAHWNLSVLRRNATIKLIHECFY